MFLLGSSRGSLPTGGPRASGLINADPECCTLKCGPYLSCSNTVRGPGPCMPLGRSLMHAAAVCACGPAGRGPALATGPASCYDLTGARQRVLGPPHEYMINARPPCPGKYLHRTVPHCIAARAWAATLSRAPGALLAARAPRGETAPFPRRMSPPARVTPHQTRYDVSWGKGPLV